MDLCLTTEQGMLNIRVAVLIAWQGGYLFEYNPKGWYYPVGGRIMIHETSEDAARREVHEELGVEVRALQLIGVAENFFAGRGTNIHELCFFYTGEVVDLHTLPEGFVVFTEEDIAREDVRPAIVSSWVQASDTTIKHAVLQE